MSLKILLTGTFAAGKTTLCDQLALYDGVRVIPEYARELLAIRSDLQTTPEFQAILLEEQLRREAAADSRDAPLIVCDRGVLDIVCYSRFFKHTCDSDALLAKMTYDHVFLLSPLDVDVRDRFPVHLQQMRLHLHGCFEAVCSESKLKTVWLSGNLGTRLAHIQDVIGAEHLRRSSPTGNALPSRERLHKG